MHLNQKDTYVTTIVISIYMLPQNLQKNQVVVKIRKTDLYVE